MRRSLLVVAFCSVAVGCVADGVSSKGDAPPLPVDGKSDAAWDGTTLHGELAFGLDSRAVLGDGARVHAWDFSLTDEAHVTLETELHARNLDTVLYLYRRNARGDGWQTDPRENDDHGDSLASYLSEDLEAGRYRVVVQAFKPQLTGAFTLRGHCEGSGCPTGVPTCDDAAYELPESTDGPTYGCLMDLYIVMSSGLEGRDERRFASDERCALPELERRAFDYYLEYFADLGYGPDDWESGEGAPLEMLTGRTALRAGTLVEMELWGSDEMQLTFVFDEEGRLLGLSHSEQSPSQYWYCDGAITMPEPEPDCYMEFVANYPHPRSDFIGGESTLGELATHADPLLASAAARFIGDTGDGEGVEAEWDFERWTGPWGADYGQLRVTAGDVPDVWILVGDDGRQLGLFDSEGNVDICREEWL